MKQVECLTLYGETVLKPLEKLVMRPSVYALIEFEGKILSVINKNSQQLGLPGGGIELGERIEDALVREVKEETGLDVRVNGFFHFREQFFYYNPTDEAFHGFLFFYTCTPTSFNLASDAEIPDDEVERSEWLNIKGIELSKFMGSVREPISKFIEQHDQI